MCFWLLLLLGGGGLPQITPDQIALRLESRLSSLSTLQAEFQQTYYSSNVSTPLQEKGILYIRNPGWLRFDYSIPEVKIFVIKDDLYQEYWPEDKQLVERSLSEQGAESALLTLLSGSSGILEHYHADFDPDPPEDPGIHRIKLTPQEEEADSYILLEIDARNWLIQKAVSFDWTGNRQEFVFSRIQTDIKLSDSVFALKVPPDVDIIR